LKKRRFQMRKIRNFKVNLREREVIHNLKLITEIKEFTPQLQEAVRKEMERAKEYLSPASVFDTFEVEESIEKFGLEIEQSLKVSSISIIIATVGQDIEKEIENATNRDEKIISQIINAIGMEALNSTLNFIYKILNEDARKEESELLQNEKISGDMEKEIIKKFDAKRINVYVTENNQVKPVYTAVGLAKWVPRKKR